MSDKIGLYIHIPFCKRKCLYCDFISGKYLEKEIKEYIEILISEIEDKSKKELRQVDTIYFGGGTPSYIDSIYIKNIIERIYNSYNVSENVEITIEINPGTLGEDDVKLKQYKDIGINRLSIGLQSANDEELKLLGRIHNVEQFEKCYKNARMLGFDNINIDIMSAIPKQTIESYEKNLLYVISLKPEHISSYSLIIEEGTPFYDMYSNNKDVFVNEEDERKMYDMTNDLLEKNGYHRYEISNYCKKGYESRHNSSYWTGRDYLGFGVAAASFVNDIRQTNTTNFREYIDSRANALSEKVILTRQNQIEEFMFLGLRMMKGISINEFKNKFGIEIDDLYKDIIDRLIGMNLLGKENERLFLTKKGIDVSNSILSQFLL